LVTVGGHGISRRYQRGFDLSDAGIISDLATLVAALPGLIAQGPAEVAVTVRDGEWIIGKCTSLRDILSGKSGLAVHVRTYL
jgi:hypothetical protein